ncbi:MAG: helix-turn-helix transcriptional regulator [Syntrophus sp. (in: bacteria)]|nr:helix-turn-helix transcriptional regulator [Syntrophus sp. (in: bacteria)]
MKPEKIIGLNIKRLRKERGWTQPVLAEKYAELSGDSCSYKYISGIETGRRWLGKTTFYRFAELFEVEPDELLLPPPGEVKFLAWEKVRFIMQSDNRELFMKVVDIFLNYRYVSSEFWAGLQALIEAAHKQIFEQKQMEKEVKRQ